MAIQYSDQRERVLSLALAALIAFVVIGHMRGYLSRRFVPADFGAFYCSGQTVLHRQDPYRVHPLLDCENSLPITNRNQGDTVNAVPLPGYDFAPLAALAALPPHAAVMLLGFLLLCATALTAYCLTRMTALPLAPAFAVAFMSSTYIASGIGQFAPIAISAVAASALLLRLGHQRWAALVGSAALLQPQFGLPVALAAFVFLPRTRVLVIAIAAVLLAVSFAAIGTAGTIEYLQVVPAHARAEVAASIQFSLTWFAHALGVNEKSAIIAGTLSYVVLFAACIVILARSGEAAVRSGAVILLPAAFAVLGGTYVHSHQISVALLAAVVLVAPAAALLSPLLGAAVLTVPLWETQYTTASALPAWILALVAAWCVVYYPSRAAGLRTAAKSATLVAGLVAVLIVCLIIARPSQSARNSGAHAEIPAQSGIVREENPLASVAGAQPDSVAVPLSYSLLLKVPIWSALAITLWFSSTTLLRKRDQSSRSTASVPMPLAGV